MTDSDYPFFRTREDLNVLMLALESATPAENGPLMAQLLAVTFDGRLDEELREYEGGTFVFTLHARHADDLERFWFVCDGPIRVAFLMGNGFERFLAIKKLIDLPKGAPVTLALLVLAPE